MLSTHQSSNEFNLSHYNRLYGEVPKELNPTSHSDDRLLSAVL